MTDHVRYTAYIDEAGDEGLGKLKAQGALGGQSTFFAIGAFVVVGADDLQLPQWRDGLVNQFPQRRGKPLHFRDLKHEQKVAVCHNLATRPFGGCVVLSYKPTIVESTKYEVFKQPQHLYNYLVRYALERITQSVVTRARMLGHIASLSVTFSRRQGTDYEVMRKYLELIRDGREVIPSVGHTIHWSIFDPTDIRVENHAVRAGLQLADVITSATYAAFEPGAYGHCEQTYCNLLRARYMKRRGGSALNCGLTLLPPLKKNPMPEAQRTFAESFNK